MSRSPKTSTCPSTVLTPHILPDGKSGHVEPTTDVDRDTLDACARAALVRFIKPQYEEDAWEALKASYRAAGDMPLADLVGFLEHTLSLYADEHPWTRKDGFGRIRERARNDDESTSVSSTLHPTRSETFAARPAEPRARSAAAGVEASHRKQVVDSPSIVRDESPGTRSSLHSRADRAIAFGSRSLPQPLSRSRGEG